MTGNNERFRISDFGVGISLALLAIVLFTSSASATTVVKMDLAALVKRAQNIVQGRVEQTYVRWDDQLKISYTYIVVRVDDPMKGDRRSTVTIRQIGGKVGALNVSVSGMPKFEAGDEVILFLQSQKDGTFQVVGLNQGKYEIVNDQAVANVSGLELIDPKTGQIRDAGFVEQAPLVEFKSKIRELLR